MKTFGELGLAGPEADLLVLGPTPAAETVVSALAVDSRAVGPGALFAALKGVARDGAEFAAAAVAQGAVGVVTSLEGAMVAREALNGWPIPFFIDEAPRRRLARLAARFHGTQPATMAAVTGTNGKTSVASFLAQIWAADGRATACFGTTGLWARNLDPAQASGGVLDEEGTLTTPEPIALHALLARLAGLGVDHAAMEASSHGLAQHRLDGVRLAAAAFTNLSRDHLDYHPTAEAYAAAKLRLFAEVARPSAGAVINADDPLFAAAAQIAEARGLRVLPFGRAAGEEGLRLIAQSPDLGGQTLRVSHAGRARALRLSLVGGFQGWNALAAAGLAIAAGMAPEVALAALERLEGVRGRMQLAARRANGAGVFVDYAHTPDALATALAGLRPHVPGRLVVAFGAGGDRDPGKRPLMGRAAASGADQVIVTDDNPRSEDPAGIRAAVAAGAKAAGATPELYGDRAEAILRGVDALGPGDALLIAGKGHERGQEIGGEILPFDDLEQARAAVAVLEGRDGGTAS